MKHLLKSSIALATLGFAFNASAVDYKKDIQPIFDNSCVKCHKAPYKDERTGRMKKPKSGLRMDSYEELMKGAEGDDDERVPVIKAGDPENSSAYTLTLLPADHDDAMPPEDKADPLTDAQKKMLHDWIKAGAKK